VKQETIKILENTGSNLFDINRSNFLLDTSRDLLNENGSPVSTGRSTASKKIVVNLGSLFSLVNSHPHLRSCDTEIGPGLSLRRPGPGAGQLRLLAEDSTLRSCSDSRGRR